MSNIPFFVFLAVLTNWPFHIFASEKNNPWIINPGISVGSITNDTSETDLIKLFGKGEVQPSEFCNDEGAAAEAVYATIVFPRNSDKKFLVLWKDTNNHVYPKEVIFEGIKSVWRTTEGISLGTSMSEIETLNGEPFSISGFGDGEYNPGLIVATGAGRIKLPIYVHGLVTNGFLRLQFDISCIYSNTCSEQELRVITSDQPIRSDNPLVKRLNPTINKMHVLFP